MGNFEKDPKWRATAPLSTSSKRAKINESGAYTSSSNAETNDDEVCPIGQKAINAQLKRKGKAKETAKKKERKIGVECGMISWKLKKKKLLLHKTR